MKKYIIYGAAIALSVAGLVATVAFAENAPATAPASAGQIMVNINPNGSVLLRGVIESIGADFIVVKSWGGVWKVKVTSATQLIRMNALSNLKVGDFVGVFGSITQDGSFIINAEFVRAWGQRSDNDKDGIPDIQDKDDDNDGVIDTIDPQPLDHDNDGIADAQDLDDDNDGIPDIKDSMPFDHDNNGKNDDMDHR